MPLVPDARGGTVRVEPMRRLSGRGLLGPLRAAVQADGGGAVDRVKDSTSCYKWTISSTTRKYHLADYDCPAAKRIDPELWKRGDQPPSVDWTLCKGCMRRQAAGLVFSSPHTLGTPDGAVIGKTVSKGPPVALDLAELASSWDSDEEGAAITSLPNVMDPERFEARGALRVLRDAGWLGDAAPKPDAILPSVPESLLDIHVPRVVQVCATWRWLLTTWNSQRTVYSITASPGLGKSTFLADFAAGKDLFPAEEPDYPPASGCRAIADVKRAIDVNDKIRKQHRFRSWDEVVQFAESTVVFGVCFNGATSYTDLETALSGREGASVLPLLARIVYTECCRSDVSWSAFLKRFEALSFGADGQLDVSVVAAEVRQILRRKRGAPAAPAVLLVDELGLVGHRAGIEAFTLLKRAMYDFCVVIEAFRLLLTSLDLAFQTLLREAVAMERDGSLRPVGSPTFVSTTTSLPPLPEPDLVAELMAKVFEPGYVVLLQQSRIVEPRLAAEAVAALSACVGRHLTFLLSSLLGAARGTSVMSIVTSASTGSSSKPFTSTELIRDHRRVLSVLVTGVEVRSTDVAAVIGESVFDWDDAIRVCGFSVSAGTDGGYGSVVAPPLMLVDAVQSHKDIIGASAGAAAGAPVDLTEVEKTDRSCLGALSSMLLACEAGGSPDQSAELHHCWWEVVASRARADLATSALPGSRAAVFRSISLHELYPDALSTRLFCGPLSEHVRVNAARARVNTFLPREFECFLQQLLDTTPEKELLDNAWRPPSMYPLIDCVVFYKCTQGVPGGPQRGQVVCIVIQNRNSLRSSTTSLDLKDIASSYASLSSIFGDSWSAWSSRTAFVVVSNRDAVYNLTDFMPSTAASHVIVSLRPELRRMYGESLYNLYVGYRIVFGGVKASHPYMLS